jgi:hypothetical protein
VCIREPVLKIEDSRSCTCVRRVIIGCCVRELVEVMCVRFLEEL